MNNIFFHTKHCSKAIVWTQYSRSNNRVEIFSWITPSSRTQPVHVGLVCVALIFTAQQCCLSLTLRRSNAQYANFKHSRAMIAAGGFLTKGFLFISAIRLFQTFIHNSFICWFLSFRSFETTLVLTWFIAVRYSLYWYSLTFATVQVKPTENTWGTSFYFLHRRLHKATTFAICM